MVTVCRGNVMQRLRAREVIRVGKKIAFETPRGGIKIANQRRLGTHDFQEIVALTQAGFVHGRRNVEHVEAFWDDQSMEIDVTSRNAVIDLARVRGMVEGILARLERRASAKIVPGQKRSLIADDPSVRQVGSNSPGRRTGLELDKLLRIRSRGQQQAVGQKAGDNHNCDDKEPEKKTKHEPLDSRFHFTDRKHEKLSPQRAQSAQRKTEGQCPWNCELHALRRTASMWHRHSCLCGRILLKDARDGKSACPTCSERGGCLHPSPRLPTSAPDQNSTCPRRVGTTTGPRSRL